MYCLRVHSSGLSAAWFIISSSCCHPASNSPSGSAITIRQVGREITTPAQGSVKESTGSLLATTPPHRVTSPASWEEWALPGHMCTGTAWCQ